MLRNIRNLLLVALFMLTISLPGLGKLIAVESARPHENRALAPPPALAGKFRLRKFTASFDAWFKDNFAFRAPLIDAYEYLNEKVLGSNDRVIMADDDWLFLTRGIRPRSTRPVPILHDLCGLAPFSSDELSRWLHALNRNQQVLAARGIEYVFVPLPNKHSVHTDKLPKHMRCSPPGYTRLDQLIDALREDGRIRFVDVRGRFRKRVEAGDMLYQPTDTHWNGLGILEAYSAIRSELAKSHPVHNAAGPGVGAPARQVRGGDLWVMNGGLGGKTETSHVLNIDAPKARRTRKTRHVRKGQAPIPLEHWEQTSPQPSELARAMFFHDSFIATRIKFLLVDSFASTTLVASAHPDIDTELVERVGPELVVHEMVERTLLLPLFR